MGPGVTKCDLDPVFGPNQDLLAVCNVLSNCAPHHRILLTWGGRYYSGPYWPLQTDQPDWLQSRNSFWQRLLAHSSTVAGPRTGLHTATDRLHIDQVPWCDPRARPERVRPAGHRGLGPAPPVFESSSRGGVDPADPRLRGRRRWRSRCRRRRELHRCTPPCHTWEVAIFRRGDGYRERDLPY